VDQNRVVLEVNLAVLDKWQRAEICVLADLPNPVTTNQL